MVFFKIRINREENENRRPRQKAKVDRHDYLKNTNKTEHDRYTYKTKNIYKTIKNSDFTKTPSVNSGDREG